MNQFGLIGLGVMGKSLALNLVDKGVKLSVFNRQIPDKEVNIAQSFEEENPGSSGFDDLSLFTASLERPRKILMMINAGRAVDDVIDRLLPHLDVGDIIMDGGNTHYQDTKRRAKYLLDKGYLFLGIGISGGQEGARNGPSLMPGGSNEGYKHVSRFLELISAKDKHNNPCCTFIGPEGAGHFVKMVHNGIEYAEMQIIAELYFLARYMLGFSCEKIAGMFQQWSSGEEGGYLLQISADILQKKDNDHLLLDSILDVAEQKETGGWSVKAALDLIVPVNTICDAVNTRIISSMKQDRLLYSGKYKKINRNTAKDSLNSSQLLAAYSASRLINHDIGFNMINKASESYNWNLNLSEIARIWTNGCILKSGLMENISTFLKQEKNLMYHESSIQKIENTYDDFAMVVSNAFKNGFSLPVVSSALTYLLNITAENSSANMIQAQRDYFGAHTYKRVDKPETEYFHTEWKL